MTSAPTGQQHQLRRGNHVATVVEVGGGLREYAVDGCHVVDGFGSQDRIDGGRGQVLVPWPNRIRDGRYTWDGTQHQLPLTEVARGNASHGLLRWTAWALRDRDEDRVRLGAGVWPQPGYPFRLDVEVEYTLTDTGLGVVVTARNTGDTPAPYGVGQHPYVTAGTALVDDWLLTVPGARRITVDDRGLPTGSESVAASTYDFRSARTIGALQLDTAYTDLDRTASGVCTIRVQDPTGGTGVDVWLGEGSEYVQVFTGDTLPDASRRRRGIAVEPMSCPPDAFRSGEGLVRLAPGQTHTLRWGLTPF